MALSLFRAPPNMTDVWRLAGDTAEGVDASVSNEVQRLAGDTAEGVDASVSNEVQRLTGDPARGATLVRDTTTLLPRA